MSLSLSELITTEDRDDVLATLLALSALLGAPTTSWQEGAPILTLLTTVAQKFSDLTVVATEVVKGGFGELLPSDAWADRWALSRFNVTRVPAVQASGPLTIACAASATGHTYAVGEIIVAHSSTHKTYRNTAAVTVVPSTTILLQPFAADEPGSASTAAPGSVTVVVSALVGITVTNPTSWVGSDAETTPTLVTRARAKLGSLSPNGAKDAYNFIATTPEFSATVVPITRTRTVGDPTSPDITVYIATAAGAPSPGDVSIVQTAIDANVEPWGAIATAVAASEHVIGITYQAWVKGSQLTSAQIQTAIGNALAKFFSTLALGGYVIPPDTGDVYIETLQQVIATATVGIQRVVVSLPLSSVSLSANEVAVLGAVSPTITLL